MLNEIDSVTNFPHPLSIWQQSTCFIYHRCQDLPTNNHSVAYPFFLKTYHYHFWNPGPGLPWEISIYRGQSLQIFLSFWIWTCRRTTGSRENYSVSGTVAKFQRTTLHPYKCLHLPFIQDPGGRIENTAQVDTDVLCWPTYKEHALILKGRKHGRLPTRTEGDLFRGIESPVNFLLDSHLLVELWKLYFVRALKTHTNLLWYSWSII